MGENFPISEKENAQHQLQVYVRDGFSYFRSGGWINIWGGAAACFGRGAVATPGKAKDNV
jgi:hypothetical protein